MVGILRLDQTAKPTLVIREVGRFPNTPVRLAEGLGWDIGALHDSVRAGLRSAIAVAREAGAEVRGIGVDAWGVDYARLTTAGQLREFVRHHRDADALLAERTASVRDLAADYAITGVLDQAINTAHQLRQDDAERIGHADDTILLTADIFVYLLTGRVGAEESLASTTGLFDRASGDWSATLTAGLPARLPPIVRGGSWSGSTTPEATAAIGADVPVPVFAVTAHDTAAAFMSVADAADDGTGIVSSGSWGVAGVVLGTPILEDRARVAGFTQEVGASGETLLVKNLSGMWLLQQTLREWAESDGEPEPSISMLTTLLADATTSDYPGRFDPADPRLQAPNGLVERLEQACIVGGVERPVSRADLVRAIVGSLADAYSEALDAAARLSGRRLQRLRIVGGGARNDLLCALTAERSGLPVIAGPVEASVRGVLLQVAIAAGDLADGAAARAIAVDDGDGPARLYRASSAESTSSPAIGDRL